MNNVTTQNATTQEQEHIQRERLTPDTEHGERISAGRIYPTPAERVDIGQNPIAQELAVTLKDILVRYIDRLYSMDHGGLSLEEENVVHHARHLLARVGMIGHHTDTHV